MFTKLFAGSLLFLGLAAAGAVATDEKATDCCSAKLACCGAKSACCIADAKSGCCQKGQKASTDVATSGSEAKSCCGLAKADAKAAGCCSAKPVAAPASCCPADSKLGCCEKGSKCCADGVTTGNQPKSCCGPAKSDAKAAGCCSAKPVAAPASCCAADAKSGCCEKEQKCSIDGADGSSEAKSCCGPATKKSI